MGVDSMRASWDITVRRPTILISTFTFYFSSLTRPIVVTSVIVSRGIHSPFLHLTQSWIKVILSRGSCSYNRKSFKKNEFKASIYCDWTTK